MKEVFFGYNLNQPLAIFKSIQHWPSRPNRVINLKLLPSKLNPNRILMHYLALDSA
jgi:hypothetical protein